MAATRALGHRLLRPGPLRSFGRAVLHALERRRGAPFVVAGSRLRFHPDAQPHTIGPQSSAHGRQENEQLLRFAEAVRTGDLIADVGAFRGVYTVVAAARAGAAGHVVAFEPFAANTRYLHANLALNRLESRVTLVEKAVAATTGALTFYSAGENSANSLLRAAIEPHAGGDITELHVATTTLDSYFAALGRAPDLVKLDVEGAELSVLRGAETIVASAARIMCELHPYAWGEAGHTGEDLRAWLRARGRELRAMTGEAVLEWQYGPVWLVRG
ncbi:MAG: FkbM family methyltransferase [Gemmatimonadota bacterium]